MNPCACNWEGAFVLRARGAFIVSSAITNNKEIPFVGIESLNGNQCKLQNPWNDTAIDIVNLDTNKKVKYKLSEDDVISFYTNPDGKYMMTNRGSNISDKTEK